MTDKEIIINMCKQLVNGITFAEANCDGLSCEGCPFDEENNDYICCGSDSDRNYKEIAKEFLKNNAVDKMKTEKTFKEVIADIKEGEVWESKSSEEHYTERKIFINESGNIVITNISNISSNVINKKQLFILQRKQYTFTEAFEAYEEGKEIESCVKRSKYQLDKDGDDIQSDNSIKFEEIRGKWYINN